MQPATSLDELRKRAAKFMQLEELREFRNQARAEASREKSKDEKDRPRGDRGKDNRDRGSRFSRYTPLTTERGRILDEALNAELIPPLRKWPALTMLTEKAVPVSSKQRALHGGMLGFTSQDREAHSSRTPTPFR